MLSIFAGSFFRNGPFTSFSEIVYSTIIGSLLTSASLSQISGVIRLSEASPLASANARSAFCAFSPSLPSISPGEKRARASCTSALTMTGSIFSLAFGFLVFGVARYSGLLIRAASMAAAAGKTNQPKKTVANKQRIISQPPAKAHTDNELGAGKFLPKGQAGYHLVRCTAGFSTGFLA